MTTTYSLEELAAKVGGELRGASEAAITGVAEVSEAQSHQATWVSSERYAPRLATSAAGVVLVPRHFGPAPIPAIYCEQIHRSVALLLGAFASTPARPAPGIHSTALVHESARIGAGTAIGPFVVIDADARIGAACVLHAGVFIGRGTVLGDDCELWPHVVVREGCVLGQRVTIHPQSVIGADGFGYYPDGGAHHKVPHIGGVRLGDDVEIGACSCVDRAKFGFTEIGRGTKIDNQVQIAHNVRIGDHCILAGQVGVSGSARIGDFCVLGGRAGVVDNVTLGSRVHLTGGLAVAGKDIPDGMTVSGFPARDHQEALREKAALRRLPELAEQVRKLIARVESLEAAAHHRP